MLLDWRRWDPARVALIGMPFVALVPKYLLILHTVGAAGTDIFQTGFGFGGYVRELFTDGSFRSCATAPFVRCDVDLCVYATRMPLLPMLYAGLGKLVGTKSAAVAMAKCTLTAVLVAVFLRSLTRDARLSFRTVALAYALYFGPQVLKHGASLEYEEGLLVDLEICLAIAVVYLLKPSLIDNRSKRVAMALAAVLLAIALYFIKTTAGLTLVVVLALVLCDRQLTWRSKAIALVCVVAPFGAWVGHNFGTSGELHLSSSWNGENLYRGSSPEGLALYPQVLLDRLFDSTHATLADGRVVVLHDLKHQRCFANEWAWNRYYSGLARSWWQEHPGDALRFVGRKLWVSLLEVRHTPYRETAEGPPTPYPRLVALAMIVWMAFARVVFLALLLCIVRGLWGGNQRQSLWTLAFVGAGWAPYAVVFAYQRHVVPLLVMAGFVLLAAYLLPRTTLLSPRDSQA